MSGEISVDKFSHLGLIFIVNQFRVNKPKSYLDFKNVIKKTQIKRCRQRFKSYIVKKDFRLFEADGRIFKQDASKVS